MTSRTHRGPSDAETAVEVSSSVAVKIIEGFQIMDARSQFLARASERRKRLANVGSPEFWAWFEQHAAEFAAEPFPMFDAYVLAHARRREEACTMREPQPDLGKEDQPSSPYPMQTQR